MIIDPHLVGSGWLEWSGGVALLRLLLRGASSKDGVEQVEGGWWRVEGDLPLTHSFDLPSEEENGGLRGILLEEERTDSGF